MEDWGAGEVVERGVEVCELWLLMSGNCMSGVWITPRYRDTPWLLLRMRAHYDWVQIIHLTFLLAKVSALDCSFTASVERHDISSS